MKDLDKEVISDIKEFSSSGERHLANKIINTIKENYMGSRIASYFNSNVYVDNDEIESAFLVGCFKALNKVDVDIGNPLIYILWQGRMAVAQLFRKRIRGNVRIYCFNCETDYSIGYKKGKRMCCPSCEKEDIESWHVFESLDSLVPIPISGTSHSGAQTEGRLDYSKSDTRFSFNRRKSKCDVESESEKTFSIATHKIQVEEIRKRLSGRKLELFDILVLEGVNRGKGTNYLEEIAERWGVTASCVAVHLGRLRKDIEEYYSN